MKTTKTYIILLLSFVILLVVFSCLGFAENLSCWKNIAAVQNFVIDNGIPSDGKIDNITVIPIASETYDAAYDSIGDMWTCGRKYYPEIYTFSAGLDTLGFTIYLHNHQWGNISLDVGFYHCGATHPRHELIGYERNINFGFTPPGTYVLYYCYLPGNYPSFLTPGENYDWACAISKKYYEPHVGGVPLNTRPYCFLLVE